MSADKEPGDWLGFRPVARAIEAATDATVRGAGAFLGRICLPAAQEFGYLLQDRVRAWRLWNLAKIAEKAEEKLAGAEGSGQLQAPPRVALAVMDAGSWAEEDDLQDMWAGILASSCTNDGRDEGNLIFVSLMSQLTTGEARLLDHVVAHCPKTASPEGLVLAVDGFMMDVPTIQQVTGVSSLHQLDLELDHLRGIDLIGGLTSGGIVLSDPTTADVTPTALAINLYVRCHGSRLTPMEFFDLRASGATGSPTEGGEGS